MSQATACPHCGFDERAEDANFCQRCGGALRGPPCAKCNAASEPGDRFCTKCGAPLPGEARGARVALGANAIPWAVAGLSLLALVVALVFRSGGGGAITMTPPPAGGADLGPASSVDLATMSPREASDRLFARVMGAIESGDREEADRFLPMAIASYDRIAALNLDDRFHLSLLHAAAGDGASALRVAEEGLAVRPTHVLDLAAAAEAALLLGDSAAAAGHYQVLTETFEEESQAGLEEYSVHGEAFLRSLLEEARAFLASRGS